MFFEFARGIQAIRLRLNVKTKQVFFRLFERELKLLVAHVAKFAGFVHDRLVTSWLVDQGNTLLTAMDHTHAYRHLVSQTGETDLRLLFGHTSQFVQNRPGAHGCCPVVRLSFALTHTGF